MFKDPIWDKYTDEELMIEYFSVLFRSDKIRREEFERDIAKHTGKTNYDDFLEFADKAIENNEQELEEKSDSLPDKISFTPDSLGDG